MSDYLPPHSIDAEQTVLGAILADPRESVGLCAERLPGVEAFYDLRHQTLYDAMLELFNAGVPLDVATLRQSLESKGRLAESGGVSYLTTIADSCPSASSLPYFADILLDKLMLRQMLKTCTEASLRIQHDKDAVQDVAALIDDVEKSVLAIRQNAVIEGVEMRQHVLNAIENMEADQHGGQLRGLSSGFSELDRHTRGLKPQNLIVIAARPSQGKSSLAMQIVERVCVDGNGRTVVFSLEMSASELTELALKRRAMIGHSGTLTEGELKRFGASTAAFSKAPLILLDRGGVTIAQIQAASRRMHQRSPLSLIVVDYLQLVRGSGRKENRSVEVGEVSRGLKMLAMELKIPIIVLAQLNRDCERDNRAPRASDLRESGSIEADADVLILIHTLKDESAIREVELRIEKNKGGPRGRIPMLFNGPLTRFENPESNPAYED